MGMLHDVFPNLQYLTVDTNDANSYGDENLYTQLPLLKSLKSLHVKGDVSHDDRQLSLTNCSNIGQCLSLECLSIRLPQFGVVDVSHFSTLVNLRSLDLRNSESECIGGLEVVLAELTELRELKISRLRGHDEELTLKSSTLTTLTLGSCRCRCLPDPHLLPALQELHVQHLTLEWDGRDVVSERDACAALQQMCDVPSFSCGTFKVREELYMGKSSCSGLLQALTDCCISPRCLPSLAQLDVCLTEILPHELLQLSELFPSEVACVHYLDDRQQDFPLKCTLAEAVQAFPDVSELLVCPPAHYDNAFSFASFTGSVFVACATAWEQERSKEHLLISIKPSVHDGGSYQAYQLFAETWTHYATCMVYEDVQPEMPIKVDLQVTNPDNFSPSDSFLDG